MAVKYKNFISFKTRMPHELRVQGSLEFKYAREITGLFDKIERDYTVNIGRRFVGRQYTPAESSTLSKMEILQSGERPDFCFSYFVSELEFWVEVSDSEIKKLADIKIDQTSIIFQEIMLSFSRYYNELVRGNDFLKPTVYGLGPQIFSLNADYGATNLAVYIAGSFSLDKFYRGEIDVSSGKLFSHFPWRYYLYKAIDCYNIHEYLDSVIWSAISIETYVMHLINESNLRREIDRRKKEGKRCTLFTEIGILREKSIISAEEKEQIRRMFSVISDYRNEIVHGDIDSTFYSKKRAFDTLNLLIDFYKKYRDNDL